VAVAVVIGVLMMMTTITVLDVTATRTTAAVPSRHGSSSSLR
jgi:hypothetical protein